MPSFKMPDIYVPFAPRISPHRDIICERMRRWAISIGLVKSEQALRRMERADFGGLVCRVHADGSEDDLTLVGIFTLLSFILDDQFDDTQLGEDPQATRAVVNNLFRLMSLELVDYPTPDNAVDAAWRYYWERVSSVMPLEWQYRLRTQIKRYLNSLLRQMKNRSRQVSPDLLSYMETRRDNGGSDIFFSHIEFINRATVPESFYNDNLGEMLRNQANDFICLTNDVFSFDKEKAQGEANNAVIVCQKLLDSTVQQSVDFVNNLAATRIESFIQIKEEIPDFLDNSKYSDQEREAIIRYVKGLESWMSGHLAWARSTHRYHDVPPVRVEEPYSSRENILGVSDHLMMPSMPQTNSGKPLGFGGKS